MSMFPTDEEMAYQRGLNKGMKMAHGVIKAASELPKLHITFTLERDDALPAFGGFLRCAPECECKDNRVLINVQAIFSPVLECEGGETVHQSKDERKRLLITTIMHEFGHVLEKHFALPDVEEAIEKACEDWEAAWRRGMEAAGEKMPETYEQQLERLLVGICSYATAVDVWRLGDRSGPAPSIDHMPTFQELPPHLQERVRAYRKEHYGIE